LHEVKLIENMRDAAARETKIEEATKKVDEGT